MTVSSEVKRKDYAGNNSTVNFATVFRFLQNSDVKVIQTVDATAVETVQVLNTNYTLLGAGLDTGGTVTMIVPPPTGTTLTVKRDVSLTQNTDYIENDEFPADSHEDALDKLTMITQQMQEELDRSLKLSEAQASSGLILPVPDNGKFLQWDANDNLLNIDIALQGALAVSDFAKTYLDDVDALTTRATLGLTIGTDVAPISSPTFTDVPAAPTASPGTNTTQLGTTAFITAAIAAIPATPLVSNITGLLPSNAADVDHDITISAGTATDSATAKQLILSSAITKQIDGAWAEGDDQPGLFSGTVAADTTYHEHIIEKDSDGTIDAGYSTSLTASDIPAGYTAFRRVSSFITDASSNFSAFTATETSGGGINVSLAVRVQDLNTASPSTVGAEVVLSVPSGIIVEAHLAFLLSGGAADIIVTEVSQTNEVPTTTNADMISTAGATNPSMNLFRLTDTSGQIRYRSSDASVTFFRFATIGWEDFRR